VKSETKSNEEPARTFQVIILASPGRGVKGDRSYDGQIPRRDTDCPLLIVQPANIEGRASAFGRLIDDPDLKRLGKMGGLLHRTRLDIDL
jgi:hypothetical protein